MESLGLCHWCTKPATALCDYPMGDGKTCSLSLCDEHRVRQRDEHGSVDVDFCPIHAKSGGQNQEIQAACDVMEAARGGYPGGAGGAGD